MNATVAWAHPLLVRGRLAEVYAWDEGCVCKLFYEKCMPTCADQEARLLRAVRQAHVPVPEVLDIVEIEGRRGIIMERIQGRSLIAELHARPWRGLALARQLAELHVLVHGCAAPDFPMQRHQLENAIRHAPDLSDRQRAAALQALTRRPDGTVLCHGALHPAHVIMAKGGPVIVDWMTASQGEPLADVARTALAILVADLMPGKRGKGIMEGMRQLFRLVYLRRYRQLRPASSFEIAAWELPVTAARLRDGISAERRLLLARLEALAAKD